MSDVSITDLIAEAQERFALSPECYSDQHIEVRLTKALKNAQTTLEADEEYINKLEGKIYSLESVTAPTENEREVFVEWRNEMHSVLENPEHLVPLEMVIDRLDAILAAGFRLPVPVEPSTEVSS